VVDDIVFFIMVPLLLPFQSFIASQVENENELELVVASGVGLLAFDPPVELVEEEEEDNMVQTK
jgi:hypothetical protein